MPVMIFQVPLWAELSAAGLGGIQGALFAADIRHRRIDVLGVLVIGLIVALGGSLLRDIALNLPVSFLHVGTLYAVAAGAGVGVLIGLLALGAPMPVAAIVGVVVTTLTRVASVVFSWTFPERPLAGRRGPTAAPPRPRAR